MVLTQIGVRTPQDKALEAHEAALMEAIAKDNENPFQRAANALFGRVHQIYSDYLYTSGVLLVFWTWWGVYPHCARFRHKRIMRFGRRSQVEFRRWFFYTRHIPKWDKKYLQRVELPRRTLNGTPATQNSSMCAGSSSLSSSSSPAPVVASHDVCATLAGPGAHDGKNYPNIFIAVRSTEAATFAGGGRGKLERDVALGVQTINESLRRQLDERRILGARSVDVGALRKEVAALVGGAGGVVVLKETNETMRSVPPDREVWWVSLEEARRRREWWFWMKILLMARVLQDLLEMPDMPDFVQ